MAKELSAETPSVPQASAYRWVVLAVLGCVATLSIVDRMVMAIVAEPVKAEFGLSDGELGLILGLAFSIPYTLASLPLGMLADRVNRMRLLGGLLFAWSLCTGLAGLAASFIGLAFARAAVGVAESGANPASFSIISDYFSKDERGSAIGLFFISTAVGTAISFSLGGLIAGHLGWRYVFFLAGAPGIALSVVIFFLMREPRRGSEPQATTEKVARPSLLSFLATRRDLGFLALGAMFTTLGATGMTVFLIPFLMRAHDLSIQSAGLLIAFALSLGTLVGTPVGGMLSDRMGRQSTIGRHIYLGAIMAIGAPCVATGLLSGSLVMVVSFLFLAKCVVNSYLGPIYAETLNAGDTRVRGSLSAMVLISCNVGAGLGPPAVGVISDQLQSHNATLALPQAMAIVACSSYVLAGICYLGAAKIVRGKRVRTERDAGPPSVQNA